MIYLDNAATTRPLPEAADAALFAAREVWHNPSAAYREGLHVERLLKTARASLARALGAEDRRIVFTSGGTEALNLALLGLTLPKKRARILVSPVEHPAVAQTLPRLAARGYEIVHLPITPEGLVPLDAALPLIDENTAMLCVMHVNNEIGAVQPIAELARRANEMGVVTVADGVQGFLHAPLPLKHVDAYALSAHKIHGLKGAGALALSPNSRLTPRLYGGGQEDGLRSGTENVPGIAAFQAAAEAMPKDWPDRLRALKLRLWAELRARIPGIILHGPLPESMQSAPHILSAAIPGTRGEVLLHALEERGVLVSTGSACSSRRHSVSPTLTAIRSPHAEGTLRFSLGIYNQPEDMPIAAEALAEAVRKYF